MRIRTEMLTELTVRKFRRMVDVIDLNPPYQREGSVWKAETRRKLIDSILNGLDIPKLYFERATTKHVSPSGFTYQYSVIDGKQRLEAVISFLRNELRLGSNFWFFEDSSVKAAGLNFEELGRDYPLLVRRLLDYELPVVSVTSDSDDLIEEMFQRLNASSALNAAERRNALSGATRDSVNELAEHRLLTECSPIRNARYKYRELAAKFLAVEHQIVTRGRVIDTKAATLYNLFYATSTHAGEKTISRVEIQKFHGRVEVTLDEMASVFEGNDWLLASIGTVVVYYMAFRELSEEGAMNRSTLAAFEELRREAARMEENNPQYAAPSSVRLREYNALVQSTNDGRALERRVEILKAYLGVAHTTGSTEGLEALADGVMPDHEEIDE